MRATEKAEVKQKGVLLYRRKQLHPSSTPRGGAIA